MQPSTYRKLHFLINIPPVSEAYNMNKKVVVINLVYNANITYTNSPCIRETLKRAAAGRPGIRNKRTKHLCYPLSILGI